jgi:hypothetical protein
MFMPGCPLAGVAHQPVTDSGEEAADPVVNQQIEAGETETVVFDEPD